MHSTPDVFGNIMKWVTSWACVNTVIYTVGRKYKSLAAWASFVGLNAVLTGFYYFKD